MKRYDVFLKGGRLVEVYAKCYTYEEHFLTFYNDNNTPIAIFRKPSGWRVMG